MKILDLEKVYNIIVHISKRQEILEYKGIFNTILPHNTTDSIYEGYSFDEFITYYSFQFFKEDIPIYSECLLVYNNDPVPHENYTEERYMFIPIPLLDMSLEQLDEWINLRILELKEEEVLKKENERQSVIKQIKFLQEKLKSYD